MIEGYADALTAEFAAIADRMLPGAGDRIRNPRPYAGRSQAEIWQERDYPDDEDRGRLDAYRVHVARMEGR